MKANTLAFFLRSYKLIIIALVIALSVLALNQWPQYQNKDRDKAKTANLNPSSMVPVQESGKKVVQPKVIGAQSNKTQTSKIQPPTPETAKPTPPATIRPQPVPAPTVAAPNIKIATAIAKYKITPAFASYKPKYVAALASPSNYGDRFKADSDGNILNNQPLAVLHETVGSAMSAVNTFRNSHENSNQQVSYHALITLDGTIVYFVPADKRAFGAGNSAFKSTEGIETVQTNPYLPPSVNNFAYHISLETPPDGRGKNSASHSGYTDNQYKSLAWLLAMSSISDNRITTHAYVDRSGNRTDPRNFDSDKFFSILHTFRQPNTVNESK